MRPCSVRTTFSEQNLGSVQVWKHNCSSTIQEMRCQSPALCQMILCSESAACNHVLGQIGQNYRNVDATSANTVCICLSLVTE